MRRIALSIILAVFVLLTSCADKPKLSKTEMDSMLCDYCKHAVEKYIHYNSVMLSTANQRESFHRLHIALIHDHPINISDIKYKVLKFNQQEKYWPIRVNFKAVIKPSNEYGINGFTANMEIDLIMHKDDFGKYSAKIAHVPGIT